MTARLGDLQARSNAGNRPDHDLAASVPGVDAPDALVAVAESAAADAALASVGGRKSC